jgi:DNA polymerase-1
MAKGEDTWRLRYGELRDVPVEQWPHEARQYALDDVSSTEALFQAQERDAPPEGLPDQFRQSRASFWLALCAGWGLLANPQKVDALETFIQAEISEHRDRLKSEGLLVPDNAKLARDFEGQGRPLWFQAPEWKRSVKLAMARTPPGWPRTDPSETHPEGQPSLAEEHCELSQDPVLFSFGKYTSLATVLNKDVKLLRHGIMHCRYGLADSGRATSFQPNVQNFKVQQYGPEKGPKFGIRECFQPRPGFLFISADFSGLELCTFAQTCIDLFRQSRLAEILNAGQDAHLEVARTLVGISYEQAKAELEADPTGRVYRARQTGKVANFGFPGGLGAAALVLFAWGNYRVPISEPEARALKATWLRTLPEARLFFEYIGALTEGGAGRITQLRSNRVRGGLRFTQACNTMFQGPGADIAKAAGWQVTERCHIRGWDNPLFGCRMVLFGHDEYVLEAPADRAPEAAEALSETMISAAKPWLPDVRIKAPPTVSTVWSKAAKSKRDASGRLVVWSQ